MASLRGQIKKLKIILMNIQVSSLPKKKFLLSFSHVSFNLLVPLSISSLHLLYIACTYPLILTHWSRYASYITHHAFMVWVNAEYTLLTVLHSNHKFYLQTYINMMGQKSQDLSVRNYTKSIVLAPFCHK